MGNDDAQTTDCTYPAFYVYGPETNYTVNIPEVDSARTIIQNTFQVCVGSEKNQWDGWVRWDPDQNGPSFSTFDQHDAGIPLLSPLILMTFFSRLSQLLPVHWLVV